MREVDGSEGGGQVVRLACTLAALTGDAVRVENVRGSRAEPGLKAQHCAAVEAVAAVCDADCMGVEVGSDAFTLDPGAVRGGRHAVTIDTAGSVALVFDAVLPLAAALDESLALSATGGTDVKWSPPMDYYRRVKVPHWRRLGVPAAVDVDRRGFYPVGGGRATLHLGPATPAPPALTGRGDLQGARVFAVAAASLADAEVADRLESTAADALSEAGIEVLERQATVAESDCPGAAVTVRLDYADTVVGFGRLGERGTPAEDLASEAVADALAFRGRGESDDEAPPERGPATAAVDAHLADQLLPLVAVAGGAVALPRVTDHVASVVDVCAAFDLDVGIREDDDGPLLVGTPSSLADRDRAQRGEL